MAVETNKVSTRMQLKLKTGVNEGGKDIIKNKTYSGVKVSADDQSIYDVANVLGGLQDYELAEIHKLEDVVLVDL